jgi:hypothetical protein
VGCSGAGFGPGELARAWRGAGRFATGSTDGPPIEAPDCAVSARCGSGLVAVGGEGGGGVPGSPRRAVVASAAGFVAVARSRTPRAITASVTSAATASAIGSLRRTGAAEAGRPRLSSFVSAAGVTELERPALARIGVAASFFAGSSLRTAAGQT